MKKNVPAARMRLYSAVAIIFYLLIWQAASMLLDQELLLASPIKVVLTFSDMLRDPSFYTAVAGSLLRIISGFIIALISGVALASVAYAIMPVRVLLVPPMSAIKATPVASFVILALIWIASKNLSVFMAFLIVLPVVYSNCLDGLDRTDKKLLEMAQVFEINLPRRIRAIYWPQMFPYFLTSIRLSLGMCWKAGIAAEVIAQPKDSIGSALYRAKVFFATPELFAWTLSIIIISFALEKLVFMAIRSLSRRLYNGD